jgi:hypothetical protein
MGMFETMMREREVRERDPAFQAEMIREKREFNDILEKLGKTASDAGYSILLKTPMKLFSGALKSIYDKKYGGEAYLKESFKLFFGKDGALHETTKVAASTIHLSGKAVKIGLRKLFAV